jgi:hypothetical protein
VLNGRRPRRTRTHAGDCVGSVCGDRMGRFCGDRMGHFFGDRMGSISSDCVGPHEALGMLHRNEEIMLTNKHHNRHYRRL